MPLGSNYKCCCVCFYCLLVLLALTTQWPYSPLPWFHKWSFLLWLGEILNNASMIPLLPLKILFQCLLLEIKPRFLFLLFGSCHSDLLRPPIALICIWYSTYSPNSESPYNNLVFLWKSFFCVFPFYVLWVNTYSAFKTQLNLSSFKKHSLLSQRKFIFSLLWPCGIWPNISHGIYYTTLQ